MCRVLRTLPHYQNDTVQMLRYLLTYWMAKFYYSYEDDPRDRNAPIVTVRWRSGDTLQLLVEAESLATTSRRWIQHIIRRRQSPLNVNFIGGGLTRPWMTAREELQQWHAPTKPEVRGPATIVAIPPLWRFPLWRLHLGGGECGSVADAP